MAKNTVISIFGLGYVGTVTAACFAQKGYFIIGVDPNELKIKIIKEGRSPIIEKDVESILAKAITQRRIQVTTDSYQAILASEISFICVGTPSDTNGSLNLTYLKKVSSEIGDALKTKKDYHRIVFRSTMLPGTIESVLIPIIEKRSSKVAGIDFGVVMNPEFLREGTAVADFYDPPKTVIGALNEEDGKELATYYKGIDAPLIITSIKVAEMIKYVDNVFHALKIVFANEVGNLCKVLDVDSLEIMDIFCLDIKLNLSSYYLKPGFAFGGSCLPKDIRALNYKAKTLDVQLPVINSISLSNELHIKGAFQRILSWGKKKIGVLGIAFKEDTDDLRESPMIELIELLIGKGYELKIYDKYVSLAKLFGANKDFIEKRIPHISKLMVSDFSSIVDFSEILIIGTKDEDFLNIFSSLHEDQIVFDFVGIAKQLKIKAKYEGICW